MKKMRKTATTILFFALVVTFWSRTVNNKMALLLERIGMGLLVVCLSLSCTNIHSDRVMATRRNPYS